MAKLAHLLPLVFMAASSLGCDKVIDLLKSDSSEHADDDEDDDDEDDAKAKKAKQKKKKAADSKKDSKTAKKDSKGKKDKILADSGFRPEKDGYKFRNTGGEYPRSAAVLTDNVMVKLFGSGACEGGDVESCRLTPPAEEWADMVNRAMNGGQCEGMAVSSLTFFKGIDAPPSFSPLNHSAHSLERTQATPFIAYYWASQVLNPVMRETAMSKRRSTPNSVEDQLVEMFKRNELATLAFWGPPGHGGHAVTPYAIEDRGNDVHWIRIYDNNYPDTERYITIDRAANTWKYDLAAINPNVPKMPWSGTADDHNIVVIPLELRLKKAVCPFCRTSNTHKTVWPWASSVSISDPQGRRVAVEGDKVINEIPDAEVLDISSFLEGATAVQPIFILPADSDYEVAIGGKDGSAPEGSTDDNRGVTIFSDGSAVAIAGVKNKPDEKDTLSLPKDGGNIRYKTATGAMPSLKLATDDEKSGLSVKIANLKGDANAEFELNLDRKVGHLTVQGGGKSTASYDIQMRHVAPHIADQLVEQKGIKFKLGDAHTIDIGVSTAKLRPGAAVAPIRISRGAFVRPVAKPGVDPKSDPKLAPRPVVAPGPRPVLQAPHPVTAPPQITKPIAPR